MSAGGLRIGPLDPDATAEFGRVSGRTSARQLVKRHAKQNPRELVAALTLRYDEDASPALDMEEVRKVAKDAGVPGEVVGANVRGDRDRQQIIAVTYRTDSGRTAKAVLNFTPDLLPESFSAVQEAVRVAKAKDEGAPWLPPEVTQLLARSLTGGKGGDASAELVEEVQSLTEQVGELRAQLAEQAESGEPAQVEVEVTAPEPFEGYEDANVEEVETKIAEVEDPFERELLKRDVRRAEEGRDKPRKGVLDATEPVQLVPAESSD